MLLSDPAVRNAKPRAKIYRLKDGDGLFLQVEPNDGKYWRLRYFFAGKEKMLALGKYPEISLSDARDKRLAARKLIANGVDPGAKKKEDKRLAVFAAGNTFEAVAKDWHDTNKSKWTPDHAERLWRRLELYAFPEIGDRPISSIKTPDLIPVLRKQEKLELLDTTRRLAQVLNTVFRFAVHCGLIDQNPASDLRGVVTPHKATNFPTIQADELPAFFEKLNGTEALDQVKIAIKLLMHTFLRPGELRKSKWADIDFKDKKWTIPAERMKMRRPHMAPLADQALVLLRELKKLTGGGAYLFPSYHRRKHPWMSENTINLVLKRMGYKGKLVGHGFRSLASTTLNEKSNFDILNEEKRAYAARGRSMGGLGSLSVGLQCEPNYGWTTVGSIIPSLLWDKALAKTIESPNVTRLIKLHTSEIASRSDFERYLLSHLHKRSPYADIAYFIFLSQRGYYRRIDQCARRSNFAEKTGGSIHTPCRICFCSGSPLYPACPITRRYSQVNTTYKQFRA
jgi:integrase